LLRFGITAILTVRTASPNETNTQVTDAHVYSDFNVTDPTGWNITSMFSNNLMSTSVTTASYEIRSGVSSGNGGTLLFSGTLPATQMPTGRSGFGFTEYMVQVSGLSIHLAPGTYHMNVTPIDSGSGLSFNSTTSGGNAVGSPPGNNANEFFTSVDFGANFVPTTDPSVAAGSDFSNGVIGTVASGTATPTATGTPCNDNLGSWTLAATFPGGVMESPAVASDGTYAYAAGGYNGSPTNGMYRYDPAANTWLTLATMPVALYDARAAYAPNTNSVYVFGGYDGGSVISSNYRYDIATGTWSGMAPMPAARIWPNVAYVGGKIYVISGLDSGFNDTAQTWEYDPVANSWNTARANDPAGQGGATTSVNGGFIYVAGGFGGGGGATTHNRYDVASDTWTAMAPLPVAMFLGAGGSIGGRNYVIGGGNPASPGHARQVADARTYTPDASYTSTLIYDVAGNSWTSGPGTNVPHSYTGGTAVGNTLVIVTGYNGSTGDTNIVETNTVSGCQSPTPTASCTPGTPVVLYDQTDNGTTFLHKLTGLRGRK
jgi:hypothetical protein